MSENRRAKIKTNLLTQDTDYLLDIWQNGDIDEWEEAVFEAVQEILLERLGVVPPQSADRQVARFLDRVADDIENKAFDKAISGCESAIQIKPNSAAAYHYLGVIYDEMGQLETAIIHYQKAIQLDPDDQEAWEDMLIVEAALEEAFEESVAKQHLDNALELSYGDEPEMALAECEAAKPFMPSLAIAYNYLGLILQTVDQFEPAIDSYLKAIELNPRFFAARKNLANARIRWEEEQYQTFSDSTPAEEQEINPEFDESEIQESTEPIPQWLYMDKRSLLLVGWAGHRTRYGRSGYDPLELDFEQAHMQGVMIRLLLIRKFRTRNPVFLLTMTFVGVICFFGGLFPFIGGNWFGIFAGILYSPLTIVGALLLMNVYLSLRLGKEDEYEDQGKIFF